MRDAAGGAARNAGRGAEAGELPGVALGDDDGARGTQAPGDLGVLLRQIGFQRFTQYISCLWQRAFTGIHQEHDAVHHLQRAFHLATEVRVPGSIHDVDLHLVIEDRGVLGQDGDAALALQVI